MTIVNTSDYPMKDIRRLTSRVLTALKKSFTIPPIGTIVVESYDSHKWEGNYDGGQQIKVRIGNKVTYPNNWDNIATLPTWEDLYVGLLTWCVMLHFQRYMWGKRTGEERKGKKAYSRGDCQHATVRMINRWRVDANMKMIFEKAGIYADGQAPTTD
jgi:hypothetical protein